MTDGDLAAQRVRMDLFGWIPIGTEIETSFGPADLGVDIYACPLCGTLVTEAWRVIHMEHHDAADDH